MLRTTTLAAVAALALSPVSAQQDPAEPPAEEGAAEPSAQQEPAAEAPAEEAPAAEAPAGEAPAPEEGSEAPAAEATPDAAADEEAAEAPADEQAAEAPAEEEAAEAPADEAAETPVEEEAAGHAEEAEGGGHEDGHVTDYDFSFEGPFGSFDQMQLQRGLQVYTEVCAACHGLRYVPFRSLHDEGGPGLPEDQVRAYAAFYEVFDADLDDFRTAIPTDRFPQSSMENAPDLSLMAKARAGFHGPYGLGINQFLRGMGGPEYIVSLLAGYTGEDRQEAGAVLYENTTFPGGWIAMPPPLYGEDVEFEDGAPNDLVSEAKDVAAFLMWAAEPKLAARKQAGFTAVFLLIILSALLYLINKRLWSPVKHAPRRTPAE